MYSIGYSIAITNISVVLPDLLYKNVRPQGKPHNYECCS